MEKQTTGNILMIRPVHFSFNEQTATDNHYQKKGQLSSAQIQEKALAEFNAFVKKLEDHSILVYDEDDTTSTITPDSIFPNNWISFHEGKIVLYPMYAENRRLERRKDIVEHFVQHYFGGKTEVIDLSYFEKEGKFLEGTGSMVLDRENKLAYASLSQRTHEEVLNVFCEKLNYTPVTFHSLQTVKEGLKPIYHTNVMMCITEKNAIICLDVIKNETERKKVVDALEKTGKTIIEITEEQVNNFAGNMLQVHDKFGKPYLIMSQQAYKSLNQAQIEALRQENEIIDSDLSTIETYGGGSARCMMCEVFK